jgi:hypothetical protein
VLVLLAFAAVQTRRMEPRSVPYHVCNLLGGVALATSAAITTDWGFLLLNVIWAGVAVLALVRKPPRMRVSAEGRR